MHDPVAFLDGLRSHLSQTDKPIAFLIGAGGSASIRVDDGAGSTKPLIPAITELTGLSKDKIVALGPAYAHAWDLLVAECEAEGLPPQIENILSRLEYKLEAIGEVDTLVGLGKLQLQEIRNGIRMSIAEAAQPGSVPLEIPHRSLARWVGKITRSHPIEVFTLNYDLLIEGAFERERLLVFDGFVGSPNPFFAAETLLSDEQAPGSDWTRLWKIHGSVNWRWDNSTSRVIRTDPSSDGAMVLPSLLKYDQSRKQPYVALLDRLAQFLRQPNALLVTLGYSFGDQHINGEIFGALETRDRTNVYALMRSDPAPDHDLVTRALQVPHLVVAGATNAVVGTRLGPWRLVEPVAEEKSEYIDLAFDSDALLPEATSRAISGRMRIGDFVKFSLFLDSIRV